MFHRLEEAVIRIVVVVDGEHYPPVVEAALAELIAAGNQIEVAVFAGGTEKLPESGPVLGGTEVLAGAPAPELLVRALTRPGIDAVVDLSDEPVLDYRKRHVLAAVALARGVAYRGADFVFTPPPRPRLCAKPSIAVIGTGKRTGKTAAAGHLGRSLVGSGRSPVIVAMGRGGPAEPEVLRGDQIELTARDLIELADAGKHAASDYVEDAVLSRVPTVGCRRCGGGLAGAVVSSNVARGIELANELPGDFMILEGSGSSIPPAHADATMLVVPAGIGEEYLAGYMGPYRLLLADLVVVTMCEEPFGSPTRISPLISRIQGSLAPLREPDGEADPGFQVVRTVLRPAPMADVTGKTAVVATTAPNEAAPAMEGHLRSLGCEITGIVHSLSDRKRLKAELETEGQGADTLLCEIKAAGVDVAARWALGSDREVIFMDNDLVGIEGDDIDGAFERVAVTASRRFGEGTS